jgi:multidrug resistance protein, MATE family
MSSPGGSQLPEQIGVSEVLGLSWPIMVSMLSFTAMIVVDSIFVARLGTTPLAAVGMAMSVTFLVLSFAMGLLRGTRVIAAQRTGSGDQEAVRRSVWQGLWLAWAFGLVVAALAPAGDALFGLMGGSAEVSRYADEYFTVRILGAPVTFTLLALNSWFEGRGDTRTPMVATVLANGLNIVLDPLFIFGWGPIPAWGIGGAASSTVLAVGVGAAFAGWRAWLLLRGQGVSRRPDLALLRAIVRVGLPMGVSRTLEVGAWVLFVSILARIGEAELAAHVIVLRIVSVSFLPGYAIGEASGVFVGQAVGAGKPELARQAWRSSLLVAIVLMTVMGILFVTIPQPFIAVFKAAPEVAEIAVGLMIVAAAFQLADALVMVGIGSLTGAGDTRFVMVLTVAGGWLVMLPVAWLFVFALDLGAVGAWLGLVFEISVLAVIATWRVRGSAWLEHGVAGAEQKVEGAVAAAA